MYTLRVWGPLALWTPVGLRAERSTMTMGSHEAWRGMLRRVYGKWCVDYHIPKVEILKKGTKFASTSNELKFNNVGLRPVDIAVQRTQRTTIFLRDVEYLVHFQPLLEERRAGPNDSLAKVLEMTDRRFRLGQQDRSPYLGIRECKVNWELVERRETFPAPQDFNEDLGITFFGTDWHTNTNYFAPLKIEKGVLHYPSWREVLQFGLSKPLQRVS